MVVPKVTMLRFMCLIYIVCLVSSILHSSVQAVSSEVTTLLQIKAILDPQGSILTSWSSSSSSSVCSWTSITWTYKNGTLLDCSSSTTASNNTSYSVSNSDIAAYSISLPSASLQGSIPASISRLSYLTSLDLSTNNLTGGIPVSIGNSSSLQSLSLSQNQLSGAVPSSIWNLCENNNNLKSLRLDHNSFSSSIPTPASGTAPRCTALETLDLSYNLLSGSIPSFIGGFGSLTDLDLSNNDLSGQIPASFSQLSLLTDLDLSKNNLSGEIPSIKGGTASSYSGNSLLCGSPTTTSCKNGGSSGTKKGLDKRIIAALMIAVMSIVVVALAVCVAMGHKHNWGRDGWVLRGSKGELIDGEDDDDIGDGKLVRFEGGEHLNVEEVLNAPGEVLGKTSYGTVYKAKLGGGSMIALRLLREDTVKEREQFTPAIQQVGQIRYPNVVSLLAYYAGPKGEKLLVYNYLSRGSLADILYNRSVNRAPLSWARRHKIALGAARGLAYLHHGLPSQIIHGNLKSKNIIVDESFEGHLADYGLSMLMNASAQNEMIKTAAAQGYKAPELLKMSRANAKTDVYNFGIVLLEILTGKKPRETEGPEKVVVELPTHVKAAVLEERISDLFDLEIISGMRNAVDDGLVQTLQLAMGCCAPSPAVRPDIKEVVRQLEEIRPKIPTPLYTPTGMKSPRDFVF